MTFVFLVLYYYFTSFHYLFLETLCIYKIVMHFTVSVHDRTFILGSVIYAILFYFQEPLTSYRVRVACP